MKLARCTECNRIIDIDELEEIEKLDHNEVIGCGLNKDNYMPCEDCAEEGNPDGCRRIRNKNGFTKTTVSDLEDSI